MASITPDLQRLTEDAGQDAGFGQPLKRDIVAGLEKGLQVIEAFDQERTRLAIAEVAQLTGLTRAAARRYLITLTAYEIEAAMLRLANALKTR